MRNVTAYLDPGSGSMMLQVIAGGLAALAVTLKVYWRRLLVFLRIRKPEEETTAPQRESPSCLPHRSNRARSGRAMGGLPAVLHAVPVSADAPGVQGHPVPALAARVARGNNACAGARAPGIPRPLSEGHDDARVHPRPARPQLFAARAHGR